MKRCTECGGFKDADSSCVCDEESPKCLRDEMAIAALQFAWESEHATGQIPTFDGCAKRAYAIADAMIKNRNNP